MIAGLFFYIVSIFNIIYPFHIFLKLFSHKDFSPLFSESYGHFMRFLFSG